MALRPRKASLSASLAGLAAATSLIFAASPAAATDLAAEIEAAFQLQAEGRMLSARERVVKLLQAPEAQPPAARVAVLGALLDLCINGQADACVAQYAPLYAEAFKAAPPHPNPVLQLERQRLMAYYFDAGRLALGRPQVTAQILEWAPWKEENPANGGLYLRRQVLALKVLLAQGKTVEAERQITKTLSFVGSLKNPEASRSTLAWALCDLISALAEIGQTERAFGLLRAAGPFVRAALPAKGVDRLTFDIAMAELLQEVGDLERAGQMLSQAAATLREIELDADTRERLLGAALQLQAVGCAAQAQMDCARAAMAAHPYAARFMGPARAPGTFAEAQYLAARALVAALDRGADPAAAAALRAASPPDGEAAGWELIRAVGIALGSPPGAARQAGLAELGRRLRDDAARKVPHGGAWYRPGAVDQILIGLALSQAGAGQTDPDADFALFQLWGRSGPSFDADALTALSQARGELQRRAIHQALRLRARRDRFERERVQAVIARAAERPTTDEVLQRDPATRRLFREFAGRIEAAEAGVARDGTSLSGANIAPLRAFQATLKPNEAALAMAPTVGGFAYMCVRRDSVVRKVGPADMGRLRLDGRLLQAALTAGHDPSDTLDAQFPVESAVRLYDVMIRPFEGCLKPGDHIVWLPSVAMVAVPLAALLPAAPPKAAVGYDLAAADWLVKRHAISYAGSASVVLAARTGTATGADFDFLGVGDPVLSGQTVEGEPRSRAVLRGVRAGSRFEGLAELPETRDELEASARGFKSTRLLMKEAATERRFRGELVGSYRYMSFATHGLIRDDLQGLAEPALVLTPMSVADATDDGLLTASEIADLSLAARFVALSACNTANFDLTQMSQDLPALASAFAVAGVPSTLGTLWPVNSETGKQVVMRLFAGLGGSAGSGPAESLAAAQRAFLAAPPGKAYLHPRFWAPFVILGDGGAGPPAPSAGAPAVAAVELLTERGGEVLDVRRGAGGPLVRLISDRNVAGRHGAAVQALGSAGWKRNDGEIGASRVLAELGGRVIAGGYLQVEGRYVPTLEAFDRASGAPAKVWRGEGLSRADAFVLAGATVAADRMVVLAHEAIARPNGPAPSKVFGLEVGPSLEPRVMFELTVPDGGHADDGTVTPLGSHLLVTYSRRYAPRRGGAPFRTDDYDQPLCWTEAVTWLELRDPRTGELRASRELRGVVISNAAGPEARSALLGGSAQDGCEAEERAAVISVDAALETRTVWRDETLGRSEARAVSRMPGGRVFVAAQKTKVTDYRIRADRVDLQAPEDLQSVWGGMALVLGRDGTASPPRMLDSGANLFVAGADASDPQDILLGGAVGGQAAIFHLRAPAAR